MRPSRVHPNPTHRQRLATIGYALVLAALCLSFSAATSSAAPSSATAQVRAAWVQLKQAIVHRNPSAVCGMLTPRARRYFVAEIWGTTRVSSCKVAAAHEFKLDGASVPEAVHARLRHIAVRGHTATTTDTSSPFKEHWVLTPSATWKVSELAPGSDVAGIAQIRLVAS